LSAGSLAGVLDAPAGQWAEPDRDRQVAAVPADVLKERVTDLVVVDQHDPVDPGHGLGQPHHLADAGTAFAEMAQRNGGDGYAIRSAPRPNHSLYGSPPLRGVIVVTAPIGSRCAQIARPVPRRSTNGAGGSTRIRPTWR
jgi:hypothetical protein